VRLLDLGTRGPKNIRRLSLRSVLLPALAALALLGVLGGRSLGSPGDDTPPARWRIKAKAPVGPPGRWDLARDAQSRGALTDEQRREVERLRATGYLGGYEPAPRESGVTVHDQSHAWNGLNLMGSGHAPGAVLMDMEGNVVHEWHYRFDRAWPHYPKWKKFDVAEMGFWFRVHLFENGDLLAMYTGLGTIKIDKESNLLWKRLDGSHHDLQVMDDGSIYVLTQAERIIKRFEGRNRVLDNTVVLLDADGNEVRRVSLLDAFWKSPFASALRPPVTNAGIKKIDIFHTNRLELLDGRLADRLPSFREGNILLSCRNLNALAVLDMDLEKIVWMQTGMWLQQHHATVLENGNIMLYDNQGDYGSSRILEYDPVTLEIAWMYRGDETNDFFSDKAGTNQRLPNGNTLITETHFGRAFEVTRDGTIVWEYVNPERAGEKNELIAALFDVTRLPPDFPTDWAAP
jgi:hypothetical protein